MAFSEFGEASKGNNNGQPAMRGVGRHAYFIKIAAGPEQVPLKEKALEIIFARKLELFSVVACNSNGSGANIKKILIDDASNRIYFRGTQDDADALSQAGFDVRPSPAFDSVMNMQKCDR